MFFLTGFLGVLVGALITLVFLWGVIGKQNASGEDRFATGDNQYVEKIDLTVEDPLLPKRWKKQRMQ